MSDDPVITDQLDQYGQWLQRSTGLELRRPAHVDYLADDGGGRRPCGAPRVAAAVVAILAVVGVAVWLVQPTSDGVAVVLASSPSDPPGALFVLPPDSDFPSIANGRVGDGASLEDPVEILSFGARNGDRFVDMATVTIGTAMTELPTPSRTIELATGPAQVNETGLTMALQTRTHVRLFGLAGPDRADLLAVIFDGISVAPDQPASVEPPSGYELVGRTGFPSGPLPPGLYFELPATEPADGRGPIVVETGPGSSPLSAPGLGGTGLTATRINGLNAWVATRSDRDGQWNAIAWQATPNRIVAVSGHASEDDIRRIAEGLTIVDEHAWRDSLG